jgi:hypothetical protein
MAHKFASQLNGRRHDRARAKAHTLEQVVLGDKGQCQSDVARLVDEGDPREAIVQALLSWNASQGPNLLDVRLTSGR